MKIKIMENLINKNMTDTERLALAAKLDEDLDNFINGLEKRQYTEGWPEDRWQEEMEKHPFFMKNAPEAGVELSPLMEGLQQLKYDPNENTPEELANAYKEDGNFNFKHKNYRLAIIAYTEAIKVECKNSEIEATLYNNRSAANYYLKNYRSALNDCEIALKMKPLYDKVTLRAANCCFEINQFEKGVKYCDTLLEKNHNDSEILAIRQKCINGCKSRDRDARKKQQLEDKKNKMENELLQRISQLNINIDGYKDGIPRFEDLQPQVPELSEHKVYLNVDKKLIWPVIFMYPEYCIMDFIQEFAEDQTINDHLKIVFEENPEWDVENKYNLNNLNVYYENFNKTKLHKVNVNETLLKLLQSNEFTVKSGTPAIIILVQGSSAETTFLKNYL